MHRPTTVMVFRKMILLSIIQITLCYISVKASKPAEIDLNTCKRADTCVFPAKAKRESELEIFRYQGALKHRARKMFSSATVVIQVVGQESFLLYHGSNVSDIKEQYLNSRLSIWHNFMPWSSNRISVPLFNNTHIGIACDHQYSVLFRWQDVDIWLIGFLFAGIVLFFNADRLSRNVVFYYGTGISIGLLGSLLLLIFLISRHMPGKFLAPAAFFAMGSSLVAALFTYIWDNVNTLLLQYTNYILGYFAVMGLLSFIYLYWRGPVTSPRALDLMKWFIQALGLVLMYNGTQLQEVSVSVVVAILVFHNFPRCVIGWFLSSWKRRFPSRRRLLTQDEFAAQASEETRAALDQLRDYCRSPQCDAWKTISHLSSPQRFAKFVEGDSHVSDSEITYYDDLEFPELPRDESDEDEIDFRLKSL